MRGLPRRSARRPAPGLIYGWSFPVVTRAARGDLSCSVRLLLPLANSFATNRSVEGGEPSRATLEGEGIRGGDWGRVPASGAR